MKRHMAFQLEYLHLTLAHSERQCQGHPYYYCEYLRNNDRQGNHCYCPTYYVAFRLSISIFRFDLDLFSRSAWPLERRLAKSVGLPVLLTETRIKLRISQIRNDLTKRPSFLSRIYLLYNYFDQIENVDSPPQIGNNYTHTCIYIYDQRRSSAREPSVWLNPQRGTNFRWSRDICQTFRHLSVHWKPISLISPMITTILINCFCKAPLDNYGIV